MPEPTPRAVLLAGPNGAGKSTVAPRLLRGVLGVQEFVNADVIARGLSAFNVEAVAMTAGKVMLARLHELARQRVSFAFESTLASRTFAPWLGKLKDEGYGIHLVFLWLPSAEFAIDRVASRTRMGGHSVPPEVIRRRYHVGVRNFFEIYQPLATTWRFYESSGPLPILIAEGRGTAASRVANERLWAEIQGGATRGR